MGGPTGYWEGASDYYTHQIGEPSFLDLHDNLVLDKRQGSVYSTGLFESKVESLVLQHKATHPSPMFLYYPMQNVHMPLEAPLAVGESVIKCPSFFTERAQRYIRS